MIPCHCIIILFIGCGVFATNNFLPEGFLLEYRGELISEKDAEKRIYENPDCSKFMYLFENSKRKKMW
jgi:hypothetical protein